VDCVMLGGFVIFFLADAESVAVRKNTGCLVFFFLLFPSDPDLCGGGDGSDVGHIFGGVRRCRSSGSTTLLFGGLSMWIDGVAAVKVDFVAALVVVVVAKVDSLRCHRLLLWRRWLLLFQSL
jgi:hypothetical protein